MPSPSGACFLALPSSRWRPQKASSGGGLDRRVEMGLRLSIAKRWRAAARMLALAAAIAMVFGVQPPHASATQADGPHNSSHQGIASHSHFGASCLQAELDRPQAESNGAVDRKSTRLNSSH